MDHNINLNDIDLKEVIGTGDFSTVYKSVWLQNTVAVKKYRKFNYGWVKSRNAPLFIIDHKNILKLYGAAFSPAIEFHLVMEYADCGSLATHIYGSDVPSYSTEDALKWMLQCAEGLAFLHGLTPLPLFHGNLKPEKLFLVDNCRCLKIGALGSRHNAVSKYYIPPNEEVYAEKTDVYSFGIVLWEVLSRRKPFCENELPSFPLLQCIFGTRRQPPLNCVPDGLGSSNIKSLISRCWDSDKNRRPNVNTVLLNLSMIIRLYFGNVPTLETAATDHIRDVQLEEEIGRGAFGAVYKAKMYGIQLALKRIFVNDADAKKGIEREVKYLSSAYHENIIKFYCTMEDKECKTLILMEFADCGSLHNYMYRDRKERNYTYVAALNWMQQLAKGVAYLHAMKPKPVIHRDLKPHNLLLANNYRTLKIADFGTVTEQATLMTMTIGTPGYMSPEIVNAQRYTEKSDVFSFGIVFWEVMAHKRPFYHLENNEPVAMLIQVSKGKHPPLKDVENCQNAEKLKKVLKRCWNILPKSRPTMDILKEKLNKLYLQS
ncbi:dual specificity protein kinase pyk3-like [Drosophila montana]|uniref:dual specificity protein kinase pyk3-like n=1 Tax=Drosophila montana TaxID=40370 RepID=UPI00313A88E4